MSKDKLITLLDGAFSNGTPFIGYTADYVYALIPLGGGKWNEVSFDIQSGELDERTINSTIAFRMLMEEIEKGISQELEDFMLGKFKEFKESIASKPDEEKLTSIIKELITNTNVYSAKLPIVKSKDGIGAVKSKL
jgi:uncharacterized protein YktA (UPF0223 family)